MMPRALLGKSAAMSAYLKLVMKSIMPVISHGQAPTPNFMPLMNGSSGKNRNLLVTLKPPVFR